MDTGARFCWTELGTTDVGKAARFYGRLLGWSEQLQPLRARSGRSLDYTILALGGRNVGGLHPLIGTQRKQGMPPRWLSYVFVADASAATARAGELGAAILAGPLDVSDLGRMSILQDPLGALFGIWQAGRLDRGFQARDEPGFPCWFEHVSADVSGAARFYGALFGWSPRSLGQAGASRILLEEGGSPVAGLTPSAHYDAGLSTQWLTFFQVVDCETSCQKLVAQQGSVIVAPIGTGEAERFLLARDPQGAAFGLLARADR